MTRPDTSWTALRRPGDAGSFFDLESPPAPVLEADGFRGSTAWWLAELCRLVYRREGDEIPGAAGPRRAEFLARVGLREVRFFNRGFTRAMLVESADAGSESFAALVFRGTLGWRNIRTDLDALPVRWPAGGRVHRGFVRALDRVWEGVEETLDGFEAPVFYAGHSLGAALATLAASRRPPRALYTYGAPRVGDAGFVRTLEGTAAVRVLHGGDVVARVPPPWWPYRFLHAGELHRLERQPEQVRRSWNDPPGPLADHAPVNYVASLERRMFGERAGKG